MPAYEWDRIQTIFLTVADLPLAERQAAPDHICQGDAELRAEVESLLLMDATSEASLGTAFASAIQSEATALMDTSSDPGEAHRRRTYWAHTIDLYRAEYPECQSARRIEIMGSLILQ